MTENCREHTDPGLVTVLGRGTANGLEVDATGSAGRAPCCSGTRPFDGGGEAETETAAGGAGTTPGAIQWLLTEPRMGPDDCIILLAESTARATGGRVPAAVHRVVETDEERLNVAFELRPSVPVFEKWCGDDRGRAGGVGVG